MTNNIRKFYLAPSQKSKIHVCFVSFALREGNKLHEESVMEKKQRGSSVKNENIKMSDSRASNVVRHRIIDVAFFHFAI